MTWRSLVSGLLLSMVMVILFSPGSAYADALSASEADSLLSSMDQGWQAFQRGAFAEAVLRWREAVHFAERAGQPGAQSTALIQLARAYQAMGHYRQTIQSLRIAHQLAEQVNDRPRLAEILKGLGTVYLVLDQADIALEYLQKGQHLAQETGQTDLAAAIWHNLGNLFTFQTEYTQALHAFTEGLKLAEQTGNRALAARTLTNAAVAAMRQGHPQEANTRLEQAMQQLWSLEPSHDRAYGLISLGLAYNDLRVHLPEARDRLLLQAAKALDEAAKTAEAKGDARAASYAWGHLGALYEEEHRYQEALRLTRQAAFTAQQVQAPESLYRWQWQTGRLFKALGQSDAAIAAYRRAVTTLQSFRLERIPSVSWRRTSFRQDVGPVYFELVDLLLQKAASLPERVQYEPYLKETRDTVELFKEAELRDFFQDECVEAARRETDLERVSETAIVVYPILLPDRLELLVSLPDGLKRIPVPVDAATLTPVVREFRRMLEKRTTREYLPLAQQLYTWLIRPLEADLAATAIDTLVFVPDGVLRTIPMAALHDGEQFLIRKYAVATTPGLDLTDPRVLPRDKPKVLAAGLSEGQQDFPALPSVRREIETIRTFYGAKVLLDQTFSTSNVEKELQQESFTIVHIASHGTFDRDADETFLLTYDGKLTMNRLAEVVGRVRFREAPLELLTLSACETAEGDDRAALGLAGVAIKAGARSALATLWLIDDRASSELVIEFYRQLRQTEPAVSRATALRNAQLQLLDGRYKHPGFWAPFLLLNNWL